MGTKSRQKKSSLSRGYSTTSTTMLFDDDPGIMSEVETSCTGFRRGGKQRSSLPVVRTPSKTLERPLGLVFLQFRKETKRALLPNEITSIDTVRALFVRSFPQQLSMEYLDSPDVKVYIHDSNKDMFYELEDHRSHLRDIRDRSVLRVIEKSDGITGLSTNLGPITSGVSSVSSNWEDQSYFSEPEFDSEFQHQHIHKSKTTKSSSGNYYLESSSTLPRSGPMLRSYSPVSPGLPGLNATSTQANILSTSDRSHGESGYMSSPERSNTIGSSTGRYSGVSYSTGNSYEEPYYSQYSGTVTPIIDEEARLRVEHMERQLANLTGLVQKALTQSPHSGPIQDYLQVSTECDLYSKSSGAEDEFDKHSSSSSASLPDDSCSKPNEKPPKLGKDKSVSFEKSVSFSDEPPDMNSPKQHSPQHTADTKPTKPAIKSSTLPRMSSQDKSRNKPSLPPKPMALTTGSYVYRDLALTPEMYNQLRGLQKKAKDLRHEVRNLRRMSQAQAHTVRETIKDTFITIRTMILSGEDATWATGDTENIKLKREEDLYKQEMVRLENDLTELESTVEDLRGNVINRKTRVNMCDVENMALILSKSSKTVADLKTRFPSLQENLKGLLSSEMEKIVHEEKFLKEEPERLEFALRRCKKLTGTLVTLKRLASVQEQRLPVISNVEPEETPSVTSATVQHSKTTAPLSEQKMDSSGIIRGASHSKFSILNQQRSENTLDALLDELQTYSRPSSQLSQVSSVGQQIEYLPNSQIVSKCSPVIKLNHIMDINRKKSVDSLSCLTVMTPNSTSTLRRLHSYPSGSDTDISPPSTKIDRLETINSLQKPPIPERNVELLQLATLKRTPPPPPPRTSSKSPLTSPTSPQLPPRNSTSSLCRIRHANKITELTTDITSHHLLQEPTLHIIQVNNGHSASDSSSCESINSQDGSQNKKDRQDQLELRHKELLQKQKTLQEQYARLQQLQRNTAGLAATPVDQPDLLKKTGSESNILAKMGLGMSATNSGSLTSLASKGYTEALSSSRIESQNSNATSAIEDHTSNSKIYETDIL
ncbi:coiled-coil domain-containing protein AGAP005037 isoform X2 [Microplitis mediator]|uniref:coiled-coil domain-containing protein AGAP005037 isoform X2 n=1 Tax=Microplitis mediator TaxID=375433 RepID=UPI00255681C0|nr:coiled-coil domain-containing protein AGAP005037 isoform X2 [Microplitis mediator]